MKVIGITGKAGSGKDTFAGYLKEALDKGSRVKGLVYVDQIARPIKDALGAMLNMPVTDLEDRELKEKSLLDDLELDYTPRQLMQTLGTEWGRKLDQDIWLKLLEPMLEIYSDFGAQFCLVTDVRFSNEQDWIENRGGCVIEIYRPLATPTSAHSSELGISREPDYFITNEGSLKGLRTQAYDLAEELLEESQVRREFNEAMSRRLNDVTPSEWDAVARKDMPF